MGLLLLAMLVALVADRLWGEPPLRWHPVVWMGRALEAFAQRIAPLAPTGRDSRSFWLAALAWCALAAMVLMVAALLQALLLWVLVPAHQPASADGSSCSPHSTTATGRWPNSASSCGTMKTCVIRG